MITDALRWGLVLGLLLTPSALWAREGGTGGARAPRRAQVQSALNHVLADLESMRTANASNPDPRSRQRVARSIERAIARVRAALASGAGRSTLTPGAHRRLTGKLRRERSPARQLALLKQATLAQVMTADQAAGLVRLIRAPAPQVAAAAHLWRRLVAGQKTRALLQAVGGAAQRRQLLRRVEPPRPRPRRGKRPRGARGAGKASTHDGH